MSSERPMTAEEQAEHDAWLRTIPVERIQEVSARVRHIADFTVSAREDAPFVSLTQWIHDGPDFITKWRADPTLEARHYQRFMRGIEACRAGYAASRYHLTRISEIEEALLTTLRSSGLDGAAGQSGAVSFGGTRKLDYEYQAFVMAYRRGLDGLAFGLSIYLKSEQSSFRKFAKALPNYHPREVALRLHAVSARYRPAFDFVMSDERGKSVRDRLAHQESVAAGTPNVTRRGTHLFGGGEDLGGKAPEAGGLTAALELRMISLHSCIKDLFLAFIAGVERHEGR